jgi:hypothetical protein
VAPSIRRRTICARSSPTSSETARTNEPPGIPSGVAADGGSAAAGEPADHRRKGRIP